MAAPLLTKALCIRSNLCVSQKCAASSQLPRSFASTTRSSHISSRACVRQRTAIVANKTSSASSTISQVQNVVHKRGIAAAKTMGKVQLRSATTQATAQQSQSESSPAIRASHILTWDQFLVIRRRRRFFNTGMSVVCAAAAAVIGAPLIGEFDIDTKVSELLGGADTIAILAVGSVSIAVVGWFAGRILGATLFQLWATQRGWARVFKEKEKSLFDRIKRYRADPTSSSPQNPVPDYYGEKIGSVAAYRTWLKDQRAFTKKMYRGVRS